MPGDSSKLTLLIYLNSEFEGGELTFTHPTLTELAGCSSGRRGDGGGGGREGERHRRQHTRIKPTAGLVVLHDHRILHEVGRLDAGRRYCIRTDVMYSTSGGDDAGPAETSLADVLAMATMVGNEGNEGGGGMYGGELGGDGEERGGGSTRVAAGGNGGSAQPSSPETPPRAPRRSNPRSVDGGGGGGDGGGVGGVGGGGGGGGGGDDGGGVDDDDDFSYLC